jgi:hypothetical protein
VLHVVLSVAALAGYILLGTWLAASLVLCVWTSIDHPQDDIPEEEPGSGDEDSGPDLMLARQAALSLDGLLLAPGAPVGDHLRMATREHWDGEDDGGTACACGRWCAERDYQGNAAYGPRAFCETDTVYIGDAIRGLPEAYAELSLRLAKTGQQEERVSGSREAPLPLNLEAETFMRHIMLVTLTWEEIVRSAACLSNPDLCTACDGDGTRDGRDCPACRGSGVVRSRDGVALQRACELLAGQDRDRTGHLGTLLSLEAAEVVRPVPGSKRLAELEPGKVVSIDSSGDAWQQGKMTGTAAGLEFLRLNGRARGMLGLSRQRRRITEVPCDGCRGKTLVQSEAKAGGWEPAVRCTACSTAYTGTHYDLLMGRVYQAQLAALEKDRTRKAQLAAAGKAS